ncbi:MAG TPA: hypothetical protein VH186_20480 [Chloroflexia bacterium]|nr:hypothetical protein [Chloroflexia bacterium]
MNSNSKIVFDPDVVDQIAQRHLGKPMAEMAEAIGRDLQDRYPDYVDVTMPLVFNSSGSIMYQLKIFAMTPHEYIMICGSSIGSSGFSGRHPAAFWDTVLSGQATYMHQDEWEARSYKTGERIFVNRWESASIDFPDHCWMLEYARGSLVWLLPFGMVNIFTNTLDFYSLLRLIRIYLTLTSKYFRKNQMALRPYLIVSSALLAAFWWLISNRKGYR